MVGFKLGRSSGPKTTAAWRHRPDVLCAIPAELDRAAAKVPAVTLVFWLIKVAATTLGETAGDAVSMSMNLGYLAATGVFAAIMAVAVTAH